MRYDNRILDFLSLDDNTLTNIRGFGSTCMNEVYTLRKLLNISSNMPTEASDKKQKAIFYNQKVKIPAELRDLEFRLIFLFIEKHENLTCNVITKLLNCFQYLNELNGITYSELLKIKGLGKKAISFLWKWLAEIHTSSCQDLLKKLGYDFSQADFSNIVFDCSCFCYSFLNKQGVHLLSDITKLDELDKLQLLKIEKIALLELRTLYFDQENERYRTKSNKMKLRQFNLASDNRHATRRSCLAHSCQCLFALCP